MPQYIVDSSKLLRKEKSVLGPMPRGSRVATLVARREPCPHGGVEQFGTVCKLTRFAPLSTCTSRFWWVAASYIKPRSRLSARILTGVWISNDSGPPSFTPHKPSRIRRLSHGPPTLDSRSCLGYYQTFSSGDPSAGSRDRPWVASLRNESERMAGGYLPPPHARPRIEGRAQ